MKTTKQKDQKLQEEPRCCLTENEHYDLVTTLFQAESGVRVIADMCDHVNPINIEIDEKFRDISNILTLAEDKLKFAQRILDK